MKITDKRGKKEENPIEDPAVVLELIQDSFKKNWTKKPGYDRARDWEMEKLQKVIDHLKEEGMA